MTVATATETCEAEGAAWLINTVCVPIVLYVRTLLHDVRHIYIYTHTDSGNVLIVSVGLAQARPNYLFLTKVADGSESYVYTDQTLFYM